MSKEQGNKFPNAQTCVLRVNICCDGCREKVKKVLHKIDGICTTTIDLEERKVTVTGNVDPAILIEQLSKAGKHAVLLSIKGGNLQKNQLQKLQLEHAKAQQKDNGKSQKNGGGGGEGGGGGGSKDKKGKQPEKPKLQQLQQQVKGFKDLKFPNLKDLKFPFKRGKKAPKEEIDDGSDYDEFEEDDGLVGMVGFDEHFYGKPKLMKPMFLQPNRIGMTESKKGAGVGGGKGGEAQVQKKGEGGKKGSGRKSGNVAHGSKNSGGNKKSKGGNGNGGKNANNSNPIPSYAGGGVPPISVQGGMVVPPEMMGGMNPYQQQYLQALMLQQQQQRMIMMMNSPGFQPMGYGYGRPVAYVPPPAVPYPHGEPYAMFSDENANSCSIM